MNLQNFFEVIPEAQTMADDMKELLNKLMEIDSPMDFDDDFATDEELEALESALDTLEIGLPEANQFKTHIVNAKAIQASTTTTFI
jgi:hypothetical protein